MSDCFVLYLLLTCMKKKTSGADKFTNNRKSYVVQNVFESFANSERYKTLKMFSLDPP